MLKAKIGEKEAEAFIQILETKVDERLADKTSVFATKEDIAKLEGRLTTLVSETKVDIIKWFVATAIAVVGLVVAFTKLL
jgi:hypothetical protein